METYIFAVLVISYGILGMCQIWGKIREGERNFIWHHWGKTHMGEEIFEEVF